MVSPSPSTLPAGDLPGTPVLNDPTKIEDSDGPKGGGEETSQVNFNPPKRISSKRRSLDDKWVTTTRFSNEDGYSWRKYGQKSILGKTYPREYYRCRHADQGCRARKHLERDGSDPTLFRVTYMGKHSCTPRPPSSPAQSDSLNLNLNRAGGCSSTPLAALPLMHPCFPWENQGHWNKDDVKAKDKDVYDFVEQDMHQQCESPFCPFFNDTVNVMEDPNGVRSITETTEMMHCFSIFFLIPADHEFEEDTLIQLWMAQEFVNDESVGQDHFNFLLNGGYLLHSGTNFVTRKARYRINTSKIESLLYQQTNINGSFYLKWENESQRNVTNSAAIQHVSLLYSDIDASVFQTLEQFSGLKTLLFLRNYGQSVTQVPDHLFFSLQKLQALDLSGTQIKKLSNFVGNLIHLRFLDLSWTLIEWLPDTICSLEELQTLKLRGCSKLHGLPARLKRLTKLRHLDVDVLRQFATIPGGIGALVNLRTLSAFMVGTDDGFKIQELKELNRLVGDFCIAMLENVGNADEAKEAALNNKKHLNKLELRWTASQLLRTNNNCYDVLKCLQPSSSLKELQIFCYEGSTFPNWVGDSTFDQLVSITFFKCEHVSELPLIEKLPRLKHLELVKMNGVKKIERRGKSEQAAFCSLEKLEVDEMQSLRCWNWVKANEDDFKNLVELSINDCPRLCDFHVLHCLSSIKHLEVRGCLKLESLSETKLPDSLEDLIVEDCPLIKRKCSQQGGEDWIKIQHVSNIRICEDDDDDDDEC